MALPLAAKIEYSKRWRDLRLPVLAINPLGRLGNVMGEYASMFAIHKIYGVDVVQTPVCNKILKPLFPHISLPVIEFGKNSTDLSLKNKIPLGTSYLSLWKIFG